MKFINRTLNRRLFLALILLCHRVKGHYLSHNKYCAAKS
jgi:hypothetical protein